MATIKLNSTGNMDSALDYAGNEKRSMKNQTREWLRANGVNEQAINSIHGRVVHKAGANGLNLFESPSLDLASGTSLSEVKKHFAAERRITHKTAPKNQAIRIKQNFAAYELDALNPADWQKANDLGVELMEKAYPDYQAAVYTHLDSEKHQLHNHIIMSRINAVTGKKFKDVTPGDSAERFKDINDEISRAQGWKVLERHKPVSVRKAQHDLDQQGIPSYISTLQHQMVELIFSPHIKDFATFKQELTTSGVETLEHGKKGNLSFHWLDENNKQRQVRGQRLGTLFNALKLQAILELPYKQRLSALRALNIDLPPTTKQPERTVINDQQRTPRTTPVAADDRTKSAARIRSQQTLAGINGKTADATERRYSALGTNAGRKYHQLAGQSHAGLTRQAESFADYNQRLVREFKPNLRQRITASFTAGLHGFKSGTAKTAYGARVRQSAAVLLASLRRLKQAAAAKRRRKQQKHRRRHDRGLER